MKTNANLPEGQNKFYFGVDDVVEFFGTVNNLTRLWHNYDRDQRAVEISHGSVDWRGERVKNSEITYLDWRDGGPQNEYDYRNFSRKFYKSPSEAIINAVFSDANLTNDPEFRKKFFEELTYDPETKCFVYFEYETTISGLPPKPVHLERFKNGVYDLYVYRHEIQVLTTNLENISLEEIKAMES